MNSDWSWPLMWSVVALAAAAVLVARAAFGTDEEPPTHPDLARACLLAAGNARTTAAWLSPGHSRRDAALLLLPRDAAWAPICAKDLRTGELLRDQILAATNEADPLNARILAESLVETLERR